MGVQKVKSKKAPAWGKGSKAKAERAADADDGVGGGAPLREAEGLLATEYEDLGVADLVDHVGRAADAVLAMEKCPEVRAYLALKTRVSKGTSAVVEAVQGDLADDEKTEVEGEEYVARVGARTRVRTITDMEGAAKRMGMATFMRVASLPLKALDDYLTPEEREEVVTEEYSGSRRAKVERIK